MKISSEQVMHVARLARLDIDPDDVAQLAGQLADVLGYMEKLNAVDTDGVAPTAHAVATTNAFRDDVVHDHLSCEKALSNAPDSDDDGSFIVPKVI